MSTFINICLYSGVSSAIISGILGIIWLSTDKGSKQIETAIDIAKSICVILIIIAAFSKLLINI